MSIPPEAIEAGAQAMTGDWNPERDPVLTAMFRDYAQSALTAALPALEQQIREQVAQEIRSARINGTARLDHLHNSVLEIAAQIARGGVEE